MRVQSTYQFKSKLEAQFVEFLFGQILSEFGHQGRLVHANGRHYWTVEKLALFKKIKIQKPNLKQQIFADDEINKTDIFRRYRWNSF